MASRTSANAQQKRHTLLQQLSDYVLDKGLMEASLRPMAKAVGTSDRMLLYYFSDKSELLNAVFDHLILRMADLLDAKALLEPLPADQLSAHILQTLRTPELEPYMHLWLQMAAHAVGGDTACRAGGERIGRVLLAWTAAQIAAPSDAVRKHDAALLLVLVEGSVLLSSLGLADIAELGLQ